MKKAYEEKITGEIRRTLRHLEEACVEQQLTMEQALKWYRASTIQSEGDTFPENTEKSHREKVEEFVGKYVDGEEKEICVFTLCYMNTQAKCPDAKQILDEISSQIKIPNTSQYNLDRKVRRALGLMLESYRGRGDNSYDMTWLKLKMPLFNLSKSL